VVLMGQSAIPPGNQSKAALHWQFGFIVNSKQEFFVKRNRDKIWIFEITINVPYLAYPHTV